MANETTFGPVIDLNADLGEGSGHDELLLAVVTSANVACGAHAGDADTMARTCAAAVSAGVAIGAHPGYPDRANVGRTPLGLGPGPLAITLREQCTALAAAATAAGGSVAYVKAHGALYERVATDAGVADVLVREARAAGLAPAALVLLGPPGAAALPARALSVVEGFADRAYAPTVGGGPARLVPRGQAGALLAHDAAVAQAVSLATTGLAYAADGAPIQVHPRSICVHGDSPGAVELAREISAELARAGVRLEAFAR